MDNTHHIFNLSITKYIGFTFGYDLLFRSISIGIPLLALYVDLPKKGRSVTKLFKFTNYWKWK